MSIENPKNENEELELEAAVAEKGIIAKEEEKEKGQGDIEMECAENFIQKEIMKSNLTPEQKAFVADYIQKNLHKGDWRHYDGKDFALAGMKIEDGILIFSFKVWLYDEEYSDTYTNIPLPVSE